MAQNFFRYDDAAGDSAVESNRAILGSLRDADCDQLISLAARRKYQAGAHIIKAQDTDRAIYFIVSGSVEIVAPEPGALSSKLATLSEGGVFGIVSFLDGAPRGSNVIAKGPVEVLMVSKDIFEQLAAWQPRIAIALLSDIGANVAMRLRKHEPIP